MCHGFQNMVFRDKVSILDVGDCAGYPRHGYGRARRQTQLDARRTICTPGEFSHLNDRKQALYRQLSIVPASSPISSTFLSSPGSEHGTPHIAAALADRQRIDVP